MDDNRTVNRAIFDKETLFKELDNEDSHKGKVIREVLNLLKIRIKEPVFDSSGKPIKPIFLKNKKIISAFLESEDSQHKLLALVNISREPQKLLINLDGVGLEFYDLISKKRFMVENGSLRLKLEPYQVSWLKLKS